MKKFIALALAMVLALTVCAAFAEETVTLKIAHIGPLTGPAALYGVATSRGAQVAIEEINAAGGKYQIELIDQDDQHNPEISLNAYQEAKKQGADDRRHHHLRSLHRRRRRSVRGPRVHADPLRFLRQGDRR